MPRSYLCAARPGMMLSKVAFTTLAFRPITPASACARSASMPSTVWPSEPMNSLGAYDASAATVSVPFDLIEAGTSDATFWSTPLAAPPPLVLAGVEGVLELLLLLLPHPAATRAAQASAARPATGRANFGVIFGLPPRWCGGAR